MKKKSLLLLMLVALLATCLFVSFGCETTEQNPTKYIVTFDLDGGTMDETSLTAIKDEVVDLTKYLPEKDGYNFVGWSCDGKEVVSINVSGDVTVVALWREKLSVSCNVGTVDVVNDVITFEATATPANEAVLTVTFNDETITPNESGLYTVTLVKGTNKFAVKGVCGSDETEVSYEVNYEGFTVVTDLQQTTTTGDESYTFDASVLYGKDSCQDVTVEFDGKAFDGNNGNYTVTFAESKQYTVTIGAVVENKHYSQTYTITYDATLPKFAEMTLAKSKSYRGEVVGFSLTATDANGTKLDDSKVEFYADFDENDGVEQFTKLTSAEISTVWSDDNATSYKLFVTNGGFADGLNKTALIKVVLTSSDKKSVYRLYRVCYIGPDADGCVGEIVVSVDGFTVGVGYILEPTVVKVYKDVKFPQHLKDLIEANGWSMEYTGGIESGFYLSCINGLDLTGNMVNQRLAQALEENYMGVEAEDMVLAPESDGTYSLGEFCYNSYSGWMYSINGKFANYGMSDYDPVDGDVLEIRFTLAYGADIGGSEALGGFKPPISVNDADYKEFNTTVAKLIAADFYGKDRAKLDEVLETVTDWDVEQSVVDEAIKALKAYYAV